MDSSTADQEPACGPQHVLHEGHALSSRHGDESRRYGPPFRHGKRLLPLGDQKTSELDRRQVRRHFEKRFTTMRMAQKYLRQYNALANGMPARRWHQVRPVERFSATHELRDIAIKTHDCTSPFRAKLRNKGRRLFSKEPLRNSFVVPYPYSKGKRSWIANM